MENILEIWRQGLKLLEEGKNISVVTVIESKGNTPAKVGKKMIVPSVGLPIGTVGGGSLEREAEQHCRKPDKKNAEIKSYDLDALGMTCGGNVTLMYEYIQGKSFFLLFGGGHVGSALAPILELMGYTVILADNREGIIDNHKEAGRSAMLCDYEDISTLEHYIASGMCFIATHNHRFDTTVLKQLLKSSDVQFGYIGMIGSSNKVRQAFKEIESEGLSIPDYVYAPVGLNIGGGAPSEIAVSIASEIIAVTYGKPVPHMRA